jgi:hypothetical protein
LFWFHFWRGKWKITFSTGALVDEFVSALLLEQNLFEGI